MGIQPVASRRTVAERRGVDDNDRCSPPLEIAEDRLDPAAEPGVADIGAPQDDQPGMGQRRRVEADLPGAEQIRFGKRRRGAGIAVRAAGKSAVAGEEPFGQQPRMVHRPPAAAGAVERHHGGAAVFFTGFPKLRGNPVQRLAPGYLPELSAAPLGRAEQGNLQALFGIERCGHLKTPDASAHVGRFERIVGDLDDFAVADLRDQRTSGAAVAVARDGNFSGGHRGEAPFVISILMPKFVLFFNRKQKTNGSK